MRSFQPSVITAHTCSMVSRSRKPTVYAISINRSGPFSHARNPGDRIIVSYIFILTFLDSRRKDGVNGSQRSPNLMCS